MGAENTDWMPEGSRWLDKVLCEKCSGACFAVSSAEKVCPQCEGLGFVESDENGLVLCPDCSGERKVEQRIEVTCEDCKGRGFHPRIVTIRRNYWMSEVQRRWGA